MSIAEREFRARQQKRKTTLKKLEGKTAVITGRTEGIAFATAKLFVKDGAYVLITGRREKELDEAVKAIGTNVTGVQGDVAKRDHLDGFYETSSKLKGRIDTKLGNAGVAEFNTSGPSPQSISTSIIFRGSSGFGRAERRMIP